MPLLYNNYINSLFHRIFMFKLGNGANSSTKANGSPECRFHSLWVQILPQRINEAAQAEKKMNFANEREESHWGPLCGNIKS